MNYMTWKMEMRTLKKNSVVKFNSMTKFLWILFWRLALSAVAAERPNILFILADDLGWGDIGSTIPRSIHPIWTSWPRKALNSRNTTWLQRSEWFEIRARSGLPIKIAKNLKKTKTI